MLWLCPACFRLEHEHCDPVRFWCSCVCYLGVPIDPWTLWPRTDEEDQ